MKCDKSFARHLLISAKIAYVGGDEDLAYRYISNIEKQFAVSTYDRYARDFARFVCDRKAEQKAVAS